MINRRPTVRLGVLASAAACCLLLVLGGAFAPSSPVRVVRAAAAQRPPSRTSLDIALEGTATASTDAAGSPASDAIDGSESTDWC
jgi:hypothetical protein